MLKFYVKVFYMMGKALSGELSGLLTGLVVCPLVSFTSKFPVISVRFLISITNCQILFIFDICESIAISLIWHS